MESKRQENGNELENANQKKIDPRKSDQKKSVQRKSDQIKSVHEMKRIYQVSKSNLKRRKSQARSAQKRKSQASVRNKSSKF